MPPLELLAASPLAFAGLASLLGLLVGSFLNVVVHRLPIMMERDWQRECAELAGTPEPEDGAAAPRYDLVTPHSQCPSCGYRIGARDNVPILSYLLLRGRCRACRVPISPRYPLVELLTGLLTAAVAWRYGFGVAALGAMALTWALIALAFIDIDRQLLPDSITLPFLWLGLACNVMHVYVDLYTAVVGAIAGYLVLWAVFHLFRLATGKIGMGHGDFKLTAMLGAWLGWPALPLVILLSSLVGAVVGLALIGLGGHDRRQPIPFGPYLAAAGWIYLMWGTVLMRLYLGAAGLD